MRANGTARWREVRGIELIGVDEDRRRETRTSLVVFVIDGFEAKSVLPVARTTSAVGKKVFVDGLHLNGRAEFERTSIAVMNERSIVFGAQRRVHAACSELFGAWREIDLIGRGGEWSAVPRTAIDDDRLMSKGEVHGHGRTDVLLRCSHCWLELLMGRRERGGAYGR